MREDDAFRDTRGPGGEEHCRRVGAGALGDLAFEERRIAPVRLAADFEQLVATHQLRLRVMPQAARLVVVDVLEGRALRQDLEQLVDLLLVLGDGVAHLGVLDRKRHLGGGSILVERHRDRAEALRGGDARVDARPVRPDQDDMVAALQPTLGEAAGEGERLVGVAPPGPGLPDAEVLLADRGSRAAHLGVVQQEFRKRIERGGLYSHRAPPPGANAVLCRRRECGDRAA